MAAWVATGQKAGVATGPCGVESRPARAGECGSAAVMVKESTGPHPLPPLPPGEGVHTTENERSWADSLLIVNSAGADVRVGHLHGLAEVPEEPVQAVGGKLPAPLL